MRMRRTAIVGLLGVALGAGCASAPAPTPRLVQSDFDVGRFTPEALAAAGGRGCGMRLWREGESREEGFVLFRALDGPAFMVLGGQMRRLRRTEAAGEDFYGQTPFQVFVTPDARVRVEVQAVPGPRVDAKSRAIPEATLTLRAGRMIQTLSVVGDAGC